MTIALRAVLVAILATLTGCPMEHALPPDLSVSEHDLREALVGVSASFTEGFAMSDAQRTVDGATHYHVGELHTFSFQNVTYRGKAWPELSFYIQRRGQDKYDLSIRCFDSPTFADEVTAELKEKVPKSPKK